MKAQEAIDLLDWKRRIFSLYAEVRGAARPATAWETWRRVRDEMFRKHPQSPIPAAERDSFGGLDYFHYDPAARVLGQIADVDPQNYEVGTSGQDTMSFTRLAEVRFSVNDEPLTLEAYWLNAYGGGLFLPFRDGTSGKETYGAGRYLFDTVKGADLGTEGDRLVLDFNFAYNPSCSYDPRWVCPLAPPPNRLDMAIEAGERL
jgi:uncharacterized protein (DUF1684 family)